MSGTGVEFIPPGWDDWNGLVGNSKYYNYKLSVNGKAEVHGDDYEKDYLTDVIGRKASEFLNAYSMVHNSFFISPTFILKSCFDSRCKCTKTCFHFRHFRICLTVSYGTCHPVGS